MRMPSEVAQLATELSRLERSPLVVLDAIAKLDIGRGRVTVVTGSPGAGKSTLIYKLLFALAQRGERVGAVLIDPSSPVTGGAILGDRLRMLESDDGIFIRSLPATSSAEGVGFIAPVMAWTLLNRGFDHVFIESVGIGQQELDVGRRGEVLALVLGPDAGDWVQFIKGGILDLCDLIAVSKADLDTGRLVREIRHSVGLQSFRSQPVPVIAVSSQSGVGIDDLIIQIDRVHDMDPERRMQSRAAVVDDIILRVVIKQTQVRLREELSTEISGDWQQRLSVARRFVDRFHIS